MVDVLSLIFFGVTHVLEWYAQLMAPLRPFLNVAYYLSSNTFGVVFALTAVLSTLFVLLVIFIHLTKRNTKEKSFNLAQAPMVTIQIPTRNEIVALDCAEKCLEFDYPKGKYEILIGDDSDDPSVSKQLLAFAAMHKGIVRVIKREKNVGFKPGNLNNLLQFSKGDIIVIFDSDFLPEKDFLKRIIAPFVHDKEVSAVQAKWDFYNFGTTLTTIIAADFVYAFHDIQLRLLQIFGTTSLCGSAEAIKKSDLIKYGGWKSGCLTEDIEYTLRLHIANKKLVYLDSLVCLSEVPHTPRDFYKQQLRWAHGVMSAYMMNAFGLIFKSSAPLYRRIIAFYTGVSYLFPVLMILMILLGVAQMLTHPPEPFNVAFFLAEFSKITLLTSGWLIVGAYVFHVEKKLAYFPRLLVSSFTIGLMTNFFINIGLYKAAVGKPVPWYLVNKKSAK